VKEKGKHPKEDVSIRAKI